MLHCAYRVAAAFLDNDSAGKGLILHLNVKSPVSAVQCVLLKEVQIFYTRHLHAEQTDMYKYRLIEQTID